jgi:hypothetical protein
MLHKILSYFGDFSASLMTFAMTSNAFLPVLLQATLE